ncbi:hypothetical protein PIB30_081585 [Stylosanthes scabra]|uniref:Uncharacterized protein n=1 Tax=Stylosanthes scabra TaxID=79078 RepID=A0ABU6ZQG2_9FABA|nr:hypothetical protein [Stylosanthes scabra]
MAVASSSCSSTENRLCVRANHDPNREAPPPPPSQPRSGVRDRLPDLPDWRRYLCSVALSCSSIASKDIDLIKAFMPSSNQVMMFMRMQIANYHVVTKLAMKGKVMCMVFLIDFPTPKFGESWVEVKIEHEGKATWAIIFFAVICCLWGQRNKIIFKNGTFHLAAAKQEPVGLGEGVLSDVWVNMGHIDDAAKLMRVITWNRSFRGIPNLYEGKDDVVDLEDHETHATRDLNFCHGLPSMRD